VRAGGACPTLAVMTTSRIDVHHHYLPAELIDELERVGIQHAGGQPLTPSRPADSLAVMDRYEIATALLSVPIPLTFGDAATTRRVARMVNEASAEAVADDPERFGLFAALPLPDVVGAMEEIAYALDTLRADGVMLLSNHAGVYLGDPRLEPVFAELDRRASVVFVHPAVYAGDRLAIDPHAGSPVPTLEPSLFEFVFDTTRAVANLIIGGTLRRHPNLRLILAHAGGTAPYVRDRILDRAPILRRLQGDAPAPTAEELQRMLSDGLADSRRQLQRLFYDVTLSTNDTVLGCLQDLVPSTHILLGTDYPMAQEIGVASTLAGLEAHSGFDDDDRRAIEGDGARHLFPRLNNWSARIPRAGDFAAAATKEESR
jgi:6-methylsalicylate decarboxylase